MVAAEGRTGHGRSASRAGAAAVFAVALLLLYLGAGTSLVGPRPGGGRGSGSGSGGDGCHPQLQPQHPKTRVAWFYPLRPPPPSGLTLREARGIATDNTGNLVWEAGGRRLLDPNRTELVDARALDPAGPPPAAVLLPTANLLVNVSRYKSEVELTDIFTRLVRGTAAPTLLVGIGTQVRGCWCRPRGWRRTSGRGW